MDDLVRRAREMGGFSPEAELCSLMADEIERLHEFVSGLACDCEGEQCKVYGEDYLRLDCGYRKARAALGEKE